MLKLLRRTDILALLDELGITTSTRDHHAVFTVAESEALHREIAGAHTKNLFFKDAKGALFLLVAEAHAEIDLKRLHRVIGCARLSFGRPELLMDVLGVTPGSVTAFSIVNDADHRVTLLLDATLARADVINCHPMTNDATTSIRRQDLLRFFEHCGHPPKVVDLAATPPEVRS
ncbi:MAG: prolyl-tRNA synthetase associated domain-containing protein [Hyphomicrobiaceae bacterium]